MEGEGKGNQELFINVLATRERVDILWNVKQEIDEGLMKKQELTFVLNILRCLPDMPVKCEVGRCIYWSGVQRSNKRN